MNIDRVAGTMTFGRPRADFPARVMAPIYGRPGPGFSARVMAGLDVPASGRKGGPGARRAALLLVPAALALVAGVMTVRASRLDPLSIPDAPRLATAPAFNAAMGTLPTLAPASPVPPVPRAAQVSRRVEAAVAPPELPAIFMIGALHGPDDIAIRSIEPAAFTIPALDAPAPLQVADLPGSLSGMQQRESKEKS